MKILGIVVIVAAVIYYIALLVTFAKGKRFLRSMLISSLSGIAVLIGVNLLSSLTGVVLNINGWTVGISASFGLPGVIAMLSAKLFF